MKSMKRMVSSAAYAIIYCFGAKVVYAATASSGYLSQYKDTNPQPTSVSFLSTIGYLLSLIVIFAFVVGLAYYVSHYLGGHFGKGWKKDSMGNVLSMLPLAPNKYICVVEIAGHIMILGITDHNITLLREINDIEEIKKLRLLGDESLEEKDFSNILNQQMSSWESFSRRVTKIFKDRYRK